MIITMIPINAAIVIILEVITTIKMIIAYISTQ